MFGGPINESIQGMIIPFSFVILYFDDGVSIWMTALHLSGFASIPRSVR
jgi:hypothetical protein